MKASVLSPARSSQPTRYRSLDRPHLAVLVRPARTWPPRSLRRELRDAADDRDAPAVGLGEASEERRTADTALGAAGQARAEARDERLQAATGELGQRPRVLRRRDLDGR